MKINDEFNVEIINLDHQGRGMGKIDNQIIFVPNSLPDEIVNVKIVGIHKQYLDGEVLSYIRVSDKRVNPICPYYGICGGCDLMSLSYDDQALYKESKIKDIIKRYVSLSCVNKIVKCDSPINYRNKVTFQVDNLVGLYKKRSYDLIYINECKIADTRINKYLQIIKTINLDHIKQVIIRTSYNDSMIILSCDKNINIDSSLFDCNVIKFFNNKYSVLKGKNYIIEEIGSKKYKISPSAFFQVNTKQAKKLYDKVEEYLELDGNEKVLDLYCGTGTIGLYIADKAKEVLGIEINKDSIVDANYNRELNKTKNISFIAGDTKDVLEHVDFKPDKIVVDPPRAGLDKKVIDELFSLKPKKLVYVSCDPMTLARDLKILLAEFDVNEITPVDMFCNTYHVECVCSLNLR